MSVPSILWKYFSKAQGYKTTKQTEVNNTNEQSTSNDNTWCMKTPDEQNNSNDLQRTSGALSKAVGKFSGKSRWGALPCSSVKLRCGEQAESSLGDHLM